MDRKESEDDAGWALRLLHAPLTLRKRQRLAQWLAATGCVKLVISLLLATGSSCFRYSKVGRWANTETRGMMEFNAFLWSFHFCHEGLAWVLSQPYRGFRISRAFPSLLYASYIAQLLATLLGLYNCGLLLLTGGPVDPGFFTAHPHAIPTLRRDQHCCAFLNHTFSQCPDPGGLPFSCCREDAANCTQCEQPGPLTYEADCGVVLAAGFNVRIIAIFVLALLLFLLTAGQLVGFRVTETGLRLAYRLGNPLANSVGWIRPAAPREALAAAVRAAGKGRRAEGWRESLDQAELLRDADECETDYEPEERRFHAERVEEHPGNSPQCTTPRSSQRDLPAPPPSPAHIKFRSQSRMNFSLLW